MLFRSMLLTFECVILLRQSQNPWNLHVMIRYARSTLGRSWLDRRYCKLVNGVVAATPTTTTFSAPRIRDLNHNGQVPGIWQELYV